MISLRAEGPDRKRFLFALGSENARSSLLASTPRPNGRGTRKHRRQTVNTTRKSTTVLLHRSLPGRLGWAERKRLVFSSIAARNLHEHPISHVFDHLRRPRRRRARR